MRTAYDQLGVPEDASDAVIASRYHELARGLHPDVTGGDKGKAEELKQHSAAYNRLKTPLGREQVDREIRDARLRQLTEAIVIQTPAQKCPRREWAAGRDATEIPFTPATFGKLASSISRLRPQYEEPWWKLGGAIADLVWLLSRR